MRGFFIIFLFFLLIIYLIYQYVSDENNKCEESERDKMLREYIPRAKTGDMVIFGGSRIRSFIIQAIIQSKYSHAGIILVLGDVPANENVVIVSIRENGIEYENLYETLRNPFPKHITIIPSMTDKVTIEKFIIFNQHIKFCLYDYISSIRIPFSRGRKINKDLFDCNKMKVTCSGYILFFLLYCFGTVEDSCFEKDINPSNVYPSEILEKKYWSKFFDYENAIEICSYYGEGTTAQRFREFLRP